MTEILTESFCERCGTRYTFESAVPSQRRLTGLKVLGRGLKNFVMSDDASLDEAMSAARSDADRDATNYQLDAFHRTFSFCMSCRQYTCANCWNETEARCLSCEPLAIDLAASETVPDIDVDPALLLRLMGGANGATAGHEHVEAVAPTERETTAARSLTPAERSLTPAELEHVQGEALALADHERVHAEAPALADHDALSSTPVAAVAWPEGFVESAAIQDESEAALNASADAVDDSATALAADVAAVRADAPADAPTDPAPVEWWAQTEAIAEDQAVAATEAPVVPVAAGHSAPMAAEPTAADEAIAVEPEAMSEDDVGAVESGAGDPTPGDALAAYEAAFSAPIPEPEITEASVLEAAGDQSQAAAAGVPTPELVAPELPLPTPEAMSEPVLAVPMPLAVVEASPASEPAAAAPVAAPATAPDAPAAPVTTPEPPVPTDHVAQPVWPAPTTPAGPAPQWPTGPRWPTGIPTGGAPSPLPPPVDALAALMARNSTEAMWAASSQEILQPAPSAPAIAAIQSCGNCGISLSATARFCRRCGTPQG